MSSTASFHPVQTTKRHRTSSQSSGSSSGNGPSRSGVANKASRISPPAEEGEEASAATHPLLCTLPPTCNHKPTPLANTKELESHYATYHAHVCEQQGCGCVFPDARLLELHQTENHDPLAAMRKERGDKIFACHLASCPKLFANPKGRRLHLISAHGYPKEYFFAVTNKGVGGLLKKWGEGASMVRGKWTPREPATTSSGPDAAPQQVVDRSTMRGSATSSGMDVDDDDESDSDEEEVEEDPLDDDDEVVLVTSSRTPDIKAFTTSKTESNRMNLDQDPEATPRPYANSSLPPIHSTPASRTADPASASADKLAAGFSTLSLVPPSVRFGRGGRGGFAHAGGGIPGHQSHQRQPSAGSQPQATTQPSENTGAGGARGGVPTRARGGQPSNRGRGGAVPNTSSDSEGGGRGHGRGRGRGRGRGGRGG